MLDSVMWCAGTMDTPLGVVPILIGPLQALMAFLPVLLAALGGAFVAMFKPSTLKRLGQLLWRLKLPLAGIVLVAVAAFIYVPKLFPANVAVVSQASGGADWAMLRGGPERRGAVLDKEADPAHGGIVSRKRDGSDQWFFASPAVVGNRVYISSVEVYGYYKDRGAIYGLDTDGLKDVWKFTGNGYRATFSSPAVKGKYLVVGEGLHVTNDCRVFCLDIKASEEARKGVKLWSFETKSHVESSPCIGEDCVVIGAGDDGLYCIELEPDAEGNAQVRWHLEGERYPDCEASPVIADGKVYMGLGNKGNAVVCIDLKSKEELWRVPTPFPVFASPTVVNGKVIVGRGTGDYVNSAEQLMTNKEAELKKEGKSEEEIAEVLAGMKPVGEVWCIDIATHKVDWTYKVKQTVLGAVAAAEDRVYFGSRDGWLYSLTMDGKEAGKWNAHEGILASPAVGKDVVYVVTWSGQMYGVDRKTMQPVWKITLSREASNFPAMSSPAVAHGHVYVGTTTNGLFCVGEPGEETQAPLWAGALGGPGRSGFQKGEQLSGSGKLGWLFPESGSSNAAKLEAAPAVLGDTLYLGLIEKNGGALAKLDLGQESTTPEKYTWTVPTKNAVVLSAAATEEAVFFVDGKPGDEGREVRRVDAKTGNVDWGKAVEAGASGAFLITREGAVLIVDRAKGLSLHQTGKADASGWTVEVGTVVGTPIMASDMVVAAVEEGPALVALDLPTGRELWRAEVKRKPLTGVLAAGGKLWVGDTEGISAYSMVNGEEVEVLKSSAVRVGLALEGNTLAAVNEKGEMLIVNPETAELKGIIKGARGDMPVVLTPEEVMFYTKGAIVLARLGKPEEKPTTVFDLAGLDIKATTPMVVRKSHIYLGTNEPGILCIKPSTK